ncbi:hypothetical protein Goshw_026694 [Gossypium schwendimanii]|uniref:Uncharacterized protein n=1 Tax=Gossypium schwendimanii TaxID=34291 RepID=A0A7J9N1W9_GOSSC|nr:hypothetical protein [Gossypium schwendimanii]
MTFQLHGISLFQGVGSYSVSRKKAYHGKGVFLIKWKIMRRSEFGQK